MLHDHDSIGDIYRPVGDRSTFECRSVYFREDAGWIYRGIRLYANESACLGGQLCLITQLIIKSKAASDVQHRWSPGTATRAGADLVAHDLKENGRAPFLSSQA